MSVKRPQALHPLKGTLSRYGWYVRKHSSRVTNHPSLLETEGFPETWDFPFENQDCSRQTRVSWSP